MFKVSKKIIQRLWAKLQQMLAGPALTETSSKRITVKRYDGMAEPPSGHWKPCHPPTITKFQATKTCPDGHGMTLKGHRVESNGLLHPSVICPNPNCSFHEFVKLSHWTFGAIEA